MIKKTDQTSKNIETSKNRVHKIKRGVVFLVLLAMILPIVFYISLAKKVYELNKRVEVLIELHQDLEQVANISKNNNGYAFASDSRQEGGKPHSDSHNNNSNEKDTKTEKNTKTKRNTKTEKDNLTQVDKKSDNENKGKYIDKVVYLTFDDGPSIYTNDIIDILNEYNVKGTFFVNGKEDEESKNIYKRIVKEGHTLGMHSYSHDYGEIYNSLEDFEKDFTKLSNLLYDTTEYQPTIFRFPGGSLNHVNENGMDEFIRYLGENSIPYYDWNVVNGDATGVEYTKSQLVQNVLDGVEKHNTAIVLMHDSASKLKTVESLPGLLEKLLSEGAQILPLDDTVRPVQQIKASSID